MSKLDLMTIIIIAVCVLAIGALIWNAKNLMDSTPQQQNTDLSEDYTDAESDDIYTDDTDEYEIDIDGDADGDNGKSNVGDAGGIGYDSDIARQAAEADAEEARIAAAEEAARQGAVTERINTNTSPKNNTTTGSDNRTSGSSNAATTSGTTRSQGRYLVVVGSYKQMASAKRMQNILRSKGYDDTSIELFNGGKFARVLVGRRSSLSAAEDLQADLVGDGVRDVLIQEKR